VFAYLRDKDSIKELFGTIAEKVATRPGGYTRILKLGNRMGDNAELAMIELVDFNEYTDGIGKKKSTKPKTRRGKKAGTDTVVEDKTETTENQADTTEA
jgi:large subunit ribosomal protein L17